MVWNHTDFGKPGRVVATGKIADLNATTVTFANGVRLTLRPSKLRAKQVLVAVKVGGGRLELPRDKASVAWATGAVLSGGLKDMSYEDMSRALTAKTVRTGFGVGEDGFVFTGSTSPDDMQTQLQVIAAYLTAPGFRPEGLEQTKSRYAAQLRQSDASPGTILRMKAPELLHDGDKRWATPSAEEVEAARIDDLKTLLTPVFATAALDVTIVGDIDPGKGDRGGGRDLWRPAATGQGAGGCDERQRHASARRRGDADRSFAQPAEQPGHRQRGVADAWRISRCGGRCHGGADGRHHAGAAVRQAARRWGFYSAGVGATASRVFDYGYIQAQAQLAPDKAGQFYDALGQITADMKAGKITADELDRARNPAMQEFEKSQQSNEYWLAVLDGIQENPHLADMARKFAGVVKAVALTDITAAAKKYLADPRMIRLTAADQR